jgi:hypothetical protein
MHGFRDVDWIDLDMRMKLMRISGKLVLIENRVRPLVEREIGHRFVERHIRRI